jgi:hypothetical protein
MISEGDLCFHTEYAVKRDEQWKTDELGYRNNSFIKDPDILLIGDSFLAGSSLTQDSTITNLIANMSGNEISSYNLAPASFSEFKALYENKVFKKPKLIIFSMVERNSFSSITQNSKDVIHNPTFLSVLKHKITRLYSINYLKSRITNKRGSGIQSPINPKMFFLNGVSQKHEKGDLIATSNIIIAHKNYCDSLGIDFLFLPMPDKETVHYELVPFQNQPNYLNLLDSILTKSNVATLNTLKIYNDYRKTSKSFLYHFDDTHWNSNATKLVANEVIKYYKHKRISANMLQ